MATTPPPFQLTKPPKPSESECDYLLGHYMRAWGQLEMAMEKLFAKLAEANQATTHIVFYSGGEMSRRRQIAEALAKQRLGTQDQTKIFSMLNGVKTATVRRNHMVHGNWQLHIKIHKDNSGKIRATIGNWVRGYMPSDLTKLGEMVHNRKMARQFHYGARQIQNFTKHTWELSKEIRDFAASVRLLPYNAPQPVDFGE